jgi:transposase InsO family protein
MDRLGFGGTRLIARILARAGWRVSARSVGRYPKARVAPTPIPEDPAPKRPTHPVFTRFVHHTWMMDVSQVKQFLGPSLYLAAVFEAHSRVPLILRVFQACPGANDMAALLRQAARAFRRPKYLVTDLGGEFTGEALLKTVRRLGIHHRFATAESIKATARLERWWRTLKGLARLSGLQLALTVEDVEQRLELALLHYLCSRPHEGLGGATPLEVLLGDGPAHVAGVEPPRGKPGEGPTEPPFRVAFLDPVGRRFLILTQVA